MKRGSLQLTGVLRIVDWAADVQALGETARIVEIWKILRQLRHTIAPTSQDETMKAEEPRNLRNGKPNVDRIKVDGKLDYPD